MVHEILVLMAYEQKHPLSYNVTSGSEITPCNKMDKPLVVYRFYGKGYDVHINVAYIKWQIITFYGRIRFQINLNVI